MDAVRTGPRVRAPELTAGFWLNSAPLRLADLRGRFVLLDFWTSGCANCWHVADELRPLEQRHADVLTVVGVHSPKFPHEGERQALAAAVERAGLTHPVLNDPELALWRQYAVRAWPTLVLVDPEGYVVAQAAGEGHVDALGRVLDERLPDYEARGTLRRGPAAEPGARPADTALRLPAKAIVLPSTRTGRAVDTLLVADSGHHQLTETTADGGSVLRRIGGPRRGAPFAEPMGLALLPPGVAAYDLLVADTANHVLRGVRLSDGAVLETIDLPALLADARTVTGTVPAVLSPWDVVWWPALRRVVVAAAGVHLLLSFDPATGTAGILAGTTVEGLRAGPALDGWLAQPSALAVDGDVLWFVDAETSALRRLTADGVLHTVVGEGLFDFGLVDGTSPQARLQHPLGVALLDDGSVVVADTYNGAVRRWDPRRGELETRARGLAEPSGLVVSDGELLVVESGAHRLVPLAEVASTAGSGGRVGTGGGDEGRGARPVSELASGPVRLVIGFTPAPGRKVDDSTGPAIRVAVTASPPELLRSGGGETHRLTRDLELAPIDGVLSVTAQIASCDDPGATHSAPAEHPACYLSRQDWGIPIRTTADGDTELRLVLFGD